VLAYGSFPNALDVVAPSESSSDEEEEDEGSEKTCTWCGYVGIKKDCSACTVELCPACLPGCPCDVLICECVDEVQCAECDRQFCGRAGCFPVCDCGEAVCDDCKDYCTFCDATVCARCMMCCAHVTAGACRDCARSFRPTA
jgi:hypothetical protein